MDPRFRGDDGILFSELNRLGAAGHCDDPGPRDLAQPDFAHQRDERVDLLAPPVTSNTKLVVVASTTRAR